MAELTTDPVRLTPGPRAPRIVQGYRLIASRRTSFGGLARKYGPAFTLNLPIFGRTVMISDPELVKGIFTTGGDLVGRATNLGEGAAPDNYSWIPFGGGIRLRGRYPALYRRGVRQYGDGRDGPDDLA